MSVSIIRPNEKLKFEFDGTTFFYKRLSAGQRVRILKSIEKKGYVNQDEAFLEMAKHCLVGWEGVKDTNGKEIKFKKDIIEYLPSLLIQILISKISDTSHEIKKAEDVEKNSLAAQEQMRPTESVETPAESAEPVS